MDFLANRNGTIARWSGLIEEGNDEEPPALVLKADADRGGPDTTLEVRWKADPVHLEKNAAEYRVTVRTGMDEELAVREVPHSARKGGEKCRFSNDDFSLLDDDTLLSAKVVVEVIGDEMIERAGERRVPHPLRNALDAGNRRRRCEGPNV